MKRSEQNAMTDIFRSHLPAVNNTTQQQDSERNVIPVTTTPEHESSRIKRLEKLIKRL